MTPEMQRMKEPGLAKLGEVLSVADERWKSGDCSPLHKRVPLDARWPKFKSLVAHRGKRYAGCTLGNFDCRTPAQREVLGRLVDFARDMPERMAWGGGVVLLGPPGTGKDHLLMGLMREAIVTHGLTVAWHDGLRLYQRIKAAISSGDTEQFLNQLCEPQVLALSDPVPPRDELTAYELSVLRDVVERRYSQLLPTWITTNVQTAGDARKLFSAAVLDRLLHGALEEFCDWPSYRTTNTTGATDG